jgi:SepF-like predicted cell division protein (DUF552 family)
MSFVDDLKRSLGFEETGTGKRSEGPGLMDMFRDALRSKEDPNSPQGNPHQYRPNPTYSAGQTPKTASNPTYHPVQEQSPVYDEEDYDDFVIVPEQSFYEIVLIRPKTIDDINYVVDQVIEEQNPVILDLSFLEKESAPNFKLAGEKIKQMRARYGAQALLLARSEDKNLIIISPKKVNVVTKK